MLSTEYMLRGRDWIGQFITHRRMVMLQRCQLHLGLMRMVIATECFNGGHDLLERDFHCAPSQYLHGGLNGTIIEVAQVYLTNFMVLIIRSSSKHARGCVELCMPAWSC